MFSKIPLCMYLFIYSLVVFWGKILLKLFVRMVHSWHLMIWSEIATLSSSWLFSLRPISILNTRVPLVLLLAGWYTVICALSDAHILNQAILSIVCWNAYDSILSEWILFVLRCAQSVEEPTIDVLGISSMSVELWYIVFRRFWKRSPTHVWHTMLVDDICFKLLILWATCFLSIISHKHDSNVLLASVIARMISAWGRTCDFNLFYSCWIASSNLWRLLIVEASLIHHIIIWSIGILIRISKFVVYTSIGSTILSGSVCNSYVSEWLRHTSMGNITCRFTSIIVRICQKVSVVTTSLSTGHLSW